MVAGRWFNPKNKQTKEFHSERNGCNELKILKPVIGQRFIKIGDDTGQVIGVIKDFHYRSLHDNIGPMAIMNSGQTYSTFLISIGPGKISKP
jgi:hypothetical protein